MKLEMKTDFTKSLTFTALEDHKLGEHKHSPRFQKGYEVLRIQFHPKVFNTLNRRLLNGNAINVHIYSDENIIIEDLSLMLVKEAELERLDQLEEEK